MNAAAFSSDTRHDSNGDDHCSSFYIYISRDILGSVFSTAGKKRGLDFPELMKRVRLEEQINRGQNRETIKKISIVARFLVSPFEVYI